MDRSLIDRVWARANNICEYCRVAQPFDLLRFQIDHIIARKHHGTDAPDNLALACFACNNHKGPNIASIDSDSGELVRLFDPRRDKWAEHFRWESAVLVGMTPTGRVNGRCGYNQPASSNPLKSFRLATTRVSGPTLCSSGPDAELSDRPRGLEEPVLAHDSCH